MYIKWIVCKVLHENKKSFFEAQLKWSLSKTAPGFIAQIGGWSCNTIDNALIVSFWKNRMYIEEFMNILHDQIVGKNNQQYTYEAIEVYHFEYNVPEKEFSMFKEKINNTQKIFINSTKEKEINLTVKDNALYVQNNSFTKDEIWLFDEWKIIL